MSIQAVSAVLDHSKATKGTRLTAISLANHADKYGLCFPSITLACEEALLERRAVQYGIKKLREIGELEIVVEADGKTHRPPLYRLKLEGLSGKIADDNRYFQIFGEDLRPGANGAPGGDAANAPGPGAENAPGGVQDLRPPGAENDPPRVQSATPGLYREPSNEPSNEVCARTPDSSILPASLSAPLSEVAETKEATIDPAAVRRACETYPDRDHVKEAEKFTAWHLHGDGRNAPLRLVAEAFRNWLKRSAPAAGDGTALAVLSPAPPSAPVVESERATAAWAAAKQLLAGQLNSSTFAIWMGPLEAAGERDGKLILLDTSDHGAGRQVSRRYRALVLEAVEGFDDMEIVDATQLELEAA